MRNLKPGEGPDTIFGYIIQGADGPVHATTGGPYLFGGFDTKFDKAQACGDEVKLAKIMIHEATHACTAAGGQDIPYDSYDFWHRGVPGCFADVVAPFKGAENVATNDCWIGLEAPDSDTVSRGISPLGRRGRMRSPWDACD